MAYSQARWRFGPPWPALRARPLVVRWFSRKKCVACHAVDGPKHGAGPSLAGVVGRRSGAAPGFKYSPTLRDLNIVWTPASLDQFLIGPQAYAKGTRMAFSGLRDPQARADLICFLQSKS